MSVVQKRFVFTHISLMPVHPVRFQDEPVVSATECWGFTESLLARLKAEYMLLEETMPGLREKVEEEEGDEGDCASSQEDDA